MEEVLVEEGRGSDPLELENWIHQLADVTFATKFVALSVEEAQALTDTYSGKCSESLPGLVARLDAAMEGEGAFVRLSTRVKKKKKRRCLSCEH